MPDSSTENTYPSNQSSTTNYWIVAGLFIAIAALSKAVSIIGQKKGPLFVVLFAGLGIAIAAIMDAMLLGDTLYVGSVIGAVVIVIGFYGVMWAQWNSTEESETHESNRIAIVLAEDPTFGKLHTIFLQEMDI
ncbi:hypothetical protein FNV43_RR19830 [Rhamnella rubrinervis]|uniref:Uncharacterized protein n=1 Tax=Rhamnella rubrinervis TaxID=2594499 RepID=A0A8K0E5A2_9ROSA|nr:hypothetical protein FNV43_RR19830 [Rhamnella rubrinervis]